MQRLRLMAASLIALGALGLGGGDKPEPVQVAGTSWHRLADGRAALLVRFEVQRDWHMYWTNPGDSGAPPTARAELPAGWKLGEPVWPRPSVHTLNGDSLFIHEGEWGWLVPVEGPAPRAVPDQPVQLDLSWMACKEACVLGRRQVKVAPPVGEPSPPPTRVGGSAFPVTPAAGDRILVEGGTLRLDLDARGCTEARFLQATDPGVSVGSRNPVRMTVAGGRATLELPLEIRPQDALGKPLAASGLVLLGPGQGDPCVWIRASVPQSASKPAVAP